MNIILLGPPGAGKGTQAAGLIEKFNLLHISTGEIFRSEIKNGTALGAKIKQFMDSGNLVPDAIVLETIKSITEKHPGSGCLFDGFPRTVVQAEGLADMLMAEGKKIDFVVYINIEDAEAVRRLTSRRACSKCGKNYNIATGPFPSKENICDSCGGDLMQRSDDTADIIRDRLKVYRDSTAPLIEYYKGKMPHGFIEVDGSKKIQDVFREIEKKINPA